jgi:hypothetical protein
MLIAHNHILHVDMGTQPRLRGYTATAHSTIIFRTWTHVHVDTTHSTIIFRTWTHVHVDTWPLASGF